MLGVSRVCMSADTWIGLIKEGMHGLQAHPMRAIVSVWSYKCANMSCLHVSTPLYMRTCAHLYACARAVLRMCPVVCSRRLADPR